MEQEINGSENLSPESALGDDPILNLKLNLIKMKVNSLLEELRTFESTTAQKREIDLVKGIDFYDEIKRFETELIVNALRCTSGHQSKAARILNVKLSTLNSKIKHYNIPVDVSWGSQSFSKKGQVKVPAEKKNLPAEEMAESIAHFVY